MDPADLLGALVRGALAGKPHKKSGKALRYLTGRGQGSFMNAGTMLTAAGVAWGLFETWQNSQTGQAASGGQWGGGSAAPVPPQTVAGAQTAPPSVPPVPGTTPSPSAPSSADIPPAVLRVVQLTVSAARADGALGPGERESILQHARTAGAESIVQGELERTRTLAEIVGGVTDAREKEALYVLAFSIIRGDESVTGAERIYLAQLAAQLGLDAVTTARLEQQAATQIDAQDGPH